MRASRRTTSQSRPTSSSPKSTPNGLLALPTCPKVTLAAFKKGTDPKDLCPVDHLAQPPKKKKTEEYIPRRPPCSRWSGDPFSTSIQKASSPTAAGGGPIYAMNILPCSRL